MKRPLYRIDLHERGEQTPTVSRVTRRQPRQLVLRYFRLMQRWQRDHDDPLEWSRAVLWKVNTWPEGDTRLGEVRNRRI